MDYPEDVKSAFRMVRELLLNQGWHTDMILDYGSWARGEARPDSDYDIEVYIHGDGVIHLFSEYAKRVANSADDASRWHRYVKEHFRSFSYSTVELNRMVNAVMSQETARPVCITNVFDTRLVLFNLIHETWSLFSLVHGSPVWGDEMHKVLMSAISRTRPFHRRFFEVHLTQCVSARQLADAYVASFSTRDGRYSWLNSMMGYLRSSLSLLALLYDGWFVASKHEILGITERRFPQKQRLMEYMNALKTNQDLHEDFLSGRVGCGDEVALVNLHRNCIEFGEEVIGTIRSKLIVTPSLSVPESEWFTEANLVHNRYLFQGNQSLEDLVGA